MNLTDGIMYKALFGGSAGSSGGSPDTGVIAVAYHSLSEYDTSTGMPYVSELVPTTDELSNAVIVAWLGGELVAERNSVLDEDGVLACLVGDTPTFVVLTEEIASAIGVSAGLYFQVPSDITDCWLIWGPKVWPTP